MRRSRNSPTAADAFVDGVAEPGDVAIETGELCHGLARGFEQLFTETSCTGPESMAFVRERDQHLALVGRIARAPDQPGCFQSLEQRSERARLQRKLVSDTADRLLSSEERRVGKRG